VGGGGGGGGGGGAYGKGVATVGEGRVSCTHTHTHMHTGLSEYLIFNLHNTGDTFVRWNYIFDFTSFHSGIINVEHIYNKKQGQKGRVQRKDGQVLLPTPSASITHLFSIQRRVLSKKYGNLALAARRYAFPLSSRLI